MNAVHTSLATRPDAPRIAELHATRITEGFLPTLGEPFLTRLYRRVVASDDAYAHVAHSRGPATGFCAMALDVGALYKRFMLRDGIVAGALAAPRIVRHARHVIETLRYPAHAGALPDAEILAVAVDPAAAGQGVGRALVEASLHELGRRGVFAAKVVAGSDNTAALALYRACGFVDVARIQVHAGIDSAILVWRAGGANCRGDESRAVSQSVTKEPTEAVRTPTAVAREAQPAGEET